MNDISEKILDTADPAAFFEMVYSAYLGEQNLPDNLVDALVSLHNKGELDIVGKYKHLLNDVEMSQYFSVACDVLGKALPRMNSSVLPVMECIQHLSEQVGNGMAPGNLATSFIDFCFAVPSRSDEALTLTLAAPNLIGVFLLPTIIAGARSNIESYFKKAVELVSDDEINVRKNAVLALGKIHYPERSEYLTQAIDSLDSAVSLEVEDNVLHSIIQSACAICYIDNSLSVKGTHIISTALSKGHEQTILAAAEEFGFQVNKLPESMLDAVLPYLVKVNPKDARSVDMIDYGVAKLLQQDDATKGIEFLEDFLLKHEKDLSVKSLDSVMHTIYKSSGVLSRLLTRWFLKGDPSLCESISDIVRQSHAENLQVEIDQEELTSPDAMHLIFVARKTVGYLFLQPVTCASVIVSLMRVATDKQVLKNLRDLLFDPLVINYSGKVCPFLKSRVESEVGLTKETILTAVEEADSYLDTLKSIPNIPEMHPSQKQREIKSRHFNRLLREAHKSSMKDSILDVLFTKSVILYGRSSVFHVQGGAGQSSRREMPMKSYETSIDIPSQEVFDPFSLWHTLSVFRCERWRS